MKVIHITTFKVVNESGVSNLATVSFPSAIDDGAWAMAGGDSYHTGYKSFSGPANAVITWEFSVGLDDPTSGLDNVFRSNQISAPCGNGGDHIRLYDHNKGSKGAFPCVGGGGTWAGYFDDSYNNTIFTQFEQAGTLPCGTFEECSTASTSLSIRKVVLRVDGWTPPPGGSVSQPVADADGNAYFGATDGVSYKLVKLNKNGLKQWEYDTSVSIGTPAVLSDGIVYFGRIGAGGVLAFTALNSDRTKKWDYENASTVQAITVNSKGESHFTYISGSQKKLLVLNPDGTEKLNKSSPDVAGNPVVLNDGIIITAGKAGGGSHLITAYNKDGTQKWQVSTLESMNNALADPSHDTATGKTYSAAGPKLFDIPQNGSVLNTHNVASWDYFATTMVAISPNTLYVGFNNINPASGSQLFALNKSDLTPAWPSPFAADSRINQQVVVDRDGNAYFSTQNGTLYSVNSAGSENWRISVGTASTVSPILVENGIIWGYGNRVVSVQNQ